MRLVDDPDFALIVGDCRDVIPCQPAVDAIVTSPPYAGQRGALEPGDGYVPWLVDRLVWSASILKPQGSMLVNLGRTYRDGFESSYIEETLLELAGYGIYRVDTIIWRKTNAHPFVAPQYLINEHEIVYWLAQRPDVYRGYGAETRRPHSPETVARHGRAGLRGPKNRERGDWQPQERTPLNPEGRRPGSVFECTVGKEKGIEHGEVMALDLARHLVALACPPGGTVLDPFLGSGTTALACRLSGRSCIGIEVDERNAAEAARRLAQQSLLAV